MSTVDRTDRKTLPPLVAGERLDRSTFHERYEAMPPGSRAELIGGVVYIPSPLSQDHSDWDADASYWLNHYRFHTPGVRVGHNATTKLDDRSEPQPDLMLMIREECGGQVRVSDRYFHDAPELVLEIGRSSRRVDLGPKKEDYERAGVQEYVFLGLDPQEVRWFVLRNERFENLPPCGNGIYRSGVFPGLWLDPEALFSDHLERLIGVLEQGLTTPEHAAFVEQLRQAREGG